MRELAPASRVFRGLLRLVPGGGVEPPRPEGRRILSPLRLPVPPSRLWKAFFIVRQAFSILELPRRAADSATGAAIFGRSTRNAAPSPGLLSTVDRAAVLSGNPLRDGEPQTCTSLRAAVSLVNAIEAFENFTLLVLQGCRRRNLAPLTVSCHPWTRATAAPSRRQG